MNKYITLLILLTLTLSPALYYLNSEQDQPEQQRTISSRKYFRNQEKTNGLLQSSTIEKALPYLTYGIKYNSVLDQFANDSNDQSTSNNLQIVAQCYVQTKFIEAENLLEISVQYTSIEKNIIGEESEENINKKYIPKLQSMERTLIKDNLVLEKIQRFDQDQLNTVQVEEEEILADFYDEPVKEQVTQRQTPFFVLHVEMDSGKIIKLLREDTYDEDKVINWITQQFVNDLFPETRAKAYEKGVVERDNLGEVFVEYEEVKVNDHQVLLSREYDSGDLLKKFVPDVKNPEFDYDRQVLMDQDTGIVESGNSVFEISLGDEDEQLLQFDGKEEQEIGAISGEINGNVIQEFWKIDAKQDLSVALGMKKYKESATLVNVFLYNHQKSEVVLGSGENEPFELVDIDVKDEVIVVKQSGGDPESEQEYSVISDDVDQYLQENTQQLLTTALNNFRNLQANKGEIFRESTLASVSVFGSTIKVDFVFSGKADKNVISVDLKVNSRLLKRFISISFNQCKSSQKSLSNQNQDFTLFNAHFPVFGIITINVSARARLQYGFDTNSSGAGGSCTATATPWIKAALYADGKASLVGIISAGIYAQGNFLETSLNLSSGVTPYTSYVTLTGDFHAFSTEVGLTYTKINCSLKNLTKRRLEDSEEVEEVQENQSARRKLGLLKKIKKAVSKVTTVVQKVASTAAKVVNTAVNVVTNLTKICTTEQGYKQLHKFATPRHSKTVFTQSIKY